MLLTEDLASKPTVQDVSGIYSPETRFLDSKEVMAESGGVPAIPKTSPLLYDSLHQLRGSTLTDLSPLVLDPLNAAPAVAEKELAHFESKNLQTQSSLKARMIQLLRANSKSLDNHGLGYMFCQGNESNLHMTNNNATMPDLLSSASPTAVPSSLLGMGSPVGAGVDMGANVGACTSLPLSIDTNPRQSTTATPFLNMQYYQPQSQGTNSTNMYFQLPGHPNLALLHTHSTNVISNSNDLLYSNGKQLIPNHYPSLIPFNYNIPSQAQLPMIPHTPQFAERQNTNDPSVHQNTCENAPDSHVVLLPPSTPFLYTPSSSNHANVDPSERPVTSSSSPATSIRKWNADDELTFFRLILWYNGTKYTKFAKSFPNKPIKSLNNKWQIEKKRAQKNMYLDWKTVIVFLLCRYLSLLERSREESILLIRSTLSTVLSTINPTEFDSFDKTSHAHYSRVLFRHICKMLGNEQLRSLDIDPRSFPV